jgi:hypothetical protein
MKLALVLTTINTPEVLKLYRAAEPTVRFFVIGDRKSDDDATQALTNTIPNSVYYSYAQQQTLGYGTNSMLPENCIQRRNLGFLEAVKWGAEAIVSIDDDNIPLDSSYFSAMNCRLQWPFNGIQVVGEDEWFDVGQYLRPVSPHRGFPIQRRHKPNYRGITKARIGVVAGICIGDPDISAVTRIANGPDVQQVSLLLQSGCVVHPNTHTVFNSQNTAVLRELIPAWGMIPFTGRYDDIFASLICQRIMRDRNLHVHFGAPFVIQQRNSHDLVRDLKGEVDGMDNVLKLAEMLDMLQLPNKSVIGDCGIIWDAIGATGLMPFEAVSAMYAFLADCEVLGL